MSSQSKGAFDSNAANAVGGGVFEISRVRDRYNPPMHRFVPFLFVLLKKTGYNSRRIARYASMTVCAKPGPSDVSGWALFLIREGGPIG